MLIGREFSRSISRSRLSGGVTDDGDLTCSQTTTLESRRKGGGSVVILLLAWTLDFIHGGRESHYELSFFHVAGLRS